MSILAVNTSVMVLEKNCYLNGYVKEDNGDTVLVQCGNLFKWFHRSSVLTFKHGRIVQLGTSNKVNYKPQITVKAKPKLKAKAKAKAKVCIAKDQDTYKQRKNRENHQLVYDIMRASIEKSSAKVLLLDDFKVGSRPIPNSTHHMIKFGIKPQNVFVPNPNPQIIQAVNKLGANGYQGMLKDMLAQTSAKNLPCFNILYLDFCGFWSYNKQAVKLLFSRHLLDINKVLIHITTCKREGASTIDDIFEDLNDWCEDYGYGTCLRIYQNHSSKMFKSSFLIVKKI